MLGIMWKASPRGALIINEKPADNKMISRVVNATKAEVEKLLRELELNKVFSRLDDGTIICRRMYYAESSEKSLSEVRADAGRKGMEKRWGAHDNKTDNKPITKPFCYVTKPDNKNNKKSEVADNKAITKKITKITASTSSSTSSSASKDIYTPQFNKFWAEYPNKLEKDVAFGVFKSLKKEEQEQVVMAARNYKIKTTREKQEKKYIKHPATFLAKNRWKDHLGTPEKEEMQTMDERHEKAMEEKK